MTLARPLQRFLAEESFVEGAMVQAAFTGEARTAGTMPVLQVSSRLEGGKTGGSGAFSFFDFLDIINPLHHLPVVGALYRHITGDEIKPFARVAGGALFGGPVGAAVAIADAALETHSGRDMGETMIAMVTGNNKKQAPDTNANATMLAQAQPARAITMADITWDDETATSVHLARTQNFRADPSATPTSRTEAEGGKNPAIVTASPDERNAKDRTGVTGPLALAENSSPQFLFLQEAPAPAAEGPPQAAPEQPLSSSELPLEVSRREMPLRMIEALDQYEKMKRLKM